ncbi:MAG: ribosome-associated translation inhibitor RaiA [Alphaproteobacteria bacterium]
MEITYNEKQVDVSEKLKAHCNEALSATVEKYFADAFDAIVSFSKEGESFDAEIVVHPAKELILKGSGNGADPYSAFDDALSKINTRLRRNKSKISARKGKVSYAEVANMSVFSFDTNNEAELEVEQTPLTIAETGAMVPTCSVSEAIMHMDLSSEDALMFKNSATNQINMVYLRKDGNIGWVEPKSA